MNPLKMVLITKIIITIIFWILPLLLIQRTWFKNLGFPEQKTLIFIRLLGVAFTALLISYIYGIVELNLGQHPYSAVYVGITSNGLGFFVLLFYSIKGEWLKWSRFAKSFMWGSLFLTFCITFCLIIYGLLK